MNGACPPPPRQPILRESPVTEFEAVVFEQAPCGFCSSNHAEPLFSGPDRLLGLPGEFTVVRCSECGLCRQNPRPTATTIDFYYPPKYEPYSLAIDDEPSLIRRWDRRYGMLKRARAIERYQPRGRLLDVGCATGNFINEMASRGAWEVEGVEPNDEAAPYARERFGLTVHTGRLTDVQLEAESFDVVTMWNVLEHLHDPMRNLEAMQYVLRPGGLFVFSIPNLEGFGVRFFGRFWMGWELPRHLYYFPRSVLDRMLSAVGMEVVARDCLVGAYPSFLLTLRFLLEAVAGDTWLTRLCLKAAGSAPARLLTAPLFWMLTRLNRASLITVFARKKPQ